MLKKIPHEKCDINKVTLVLGVHCLAFVGFYYLTPLNLLLFSVAHAFFGVFGISLGYHKFLSHRSFTPSPYFARFLATVATLCFQGGPLFWAAAHRWHHKYAEGRGDPHSAARGFFWSHVGWLFYKNPNGFSYRKALEAVQELGKDRYFLWLEKNATLLNASVLLVSGGLAWTHGQHGLWLWIFPLRIVAIWHTTWFINSLSHGVGIFKKDPSGEPVNNALLSILLYGEGLHANHHASPGRANNAWAKNQIDWSFKILCVFNALGVAEVPEKNFQEHEVSEIADFEKEAA